MPGACGGRLGAPGQGPVFPKESRAAELDRRQGLRARSRDRRHRTHRETPPGKILSPQPFRQLGHICHLFPRVRERLGSRSEGRDETPRTGSPLPAVPVRTGSGRPGAQAQVWGGRGVNPSDGHQQITSNHPSQASPVRTVASVTQGAGKREGVREQRQPVPQPRPSLPWVVPTGRSKAAAPRQPRAPASAWAAGAASGLIVCSFKHFHSACPNGDRQITCCVINTSCLFKNLQRSSRRALALAQRRGCRPANYNGVSRTPKTWSGQPRQP